MHSGSPSGGVVAASLLLRGPLQHFELGMSGIHDKGPRTLGEVISPSESSVGQMLGAGGLCCEWNQGRRVGFWGSRGEQGSR